MIVIRGAYHFAHPGESSGAAQADYFLAHGGGWSADGKTLPGMIDLEANGAQTCWGISQPEMVAFIHDFGNTYHARTGRYPMIYCGASWWNECTGRNTGFAADYPLVLADWASSRGALPAGWSYETFWQYADSGKFPGDQDLFNGDEAGLKRMALGH
jgi:GH25 family lysozyme M1 (1,4-beta-N-acetylmuramidase)